MLARVKDFLGFNPLAWAESMILMRRRVEEFVAAHPVAAAGAEPRGRYLVVVAPWLGTYVPWFSLAVGIMLAAKGARVTFAVDDRRFGPNAPRFLVVLGAIALVMRAVRQHFPVIYLSHVQPLPEDAEAEAVIERLAGLNAIWAMRGEMMVEGRAAFAATSRQQIASAYGHIAALFRSPEWNTVFVPGGIYGTSGIWRRCARTAGLRVATYDTGGYETVMLAADGLACQLQDVPRAVTQLRERFAQRPHELAASLAAADEEIAKRRQGTDAFESQIKGATSGGDELDGGILIALNSSWDAAALGPHKVFAGNTEWIVETARFLLENTRVPVIVRQHPAERLEIARTTDDYAALLTRHFGAEPRLHFIAADDPINSYALLERVAAVVVHTSTIGIEAAAFGRPVITGSTAYYSGLGFVNRADTPRQYEEFLRRAAEGELVVDAEMRETARLCMYVTQCCNWVFSVFNPGDYLRWIRQPLETWFREPAVQRMLESILDDVPVAVLNHIASSESGEAATREGRSEGSRT